MNNINLTIELCAEDRKRIEELTSATHLLASVLTASAELKQTQPAEPNESETHPADAPTTHLEPDANPTGPQLDAAGQKNGTEDAGAATEAAAPPEVTPVSLAEFQKAVTQAVAKGPKQKAAAKAIINEYAASVSAVPEDKRAEVMAKLAKI